MSRVVPILEALDAGLAAFGRFAERYFVDDANTALIKTRQFGEHHYVMETALIADVSLVKAWKADRAGNLVFRKTARNFNPACAMAGKITVAEVEEIVETGSFDPDAVHLPGIYIHRLVLNATPEKRIEKRTLSEKTK